MIYKYRPLLRPASTTTLPDGLHWVFVERPPYITNRHDLPVSQNPYGVIGTDRPLTKEECEHFDLLPCGVKVSVS